MRKSLRCLLLGVLAVAALRHVGHYLGDTQLPRFAGTGWYGALSFALAAVIDTDRSA